MKTLTWTALMLTAAALFFSGNVGAGVLALSVANVILFSAKVK